jgi:hypothetical protein
VIAALEKGDGAPEGAPFRSRGGFSLAAATTNPEVDPEANPADCAGARALADDAAAEAAP